MINITWFGHAMWKVATEKVSIIFDPFNDIGYPMPKNLTSNIVISSHEHGDHSNFKLLIPPFKKISQIGTYHIDDIRIKLIEASHGQFNGKKFGDTFLSLLTLENMTILHCGDLGSIPSDVIINEIEDIDILFVPIGGHYTLDAQSAKQFIELVKPKIVFPMHYKTEVSKIDGIEGIEPFLELFPETEKIDSNTTTINKKSFKPKKPRYIILNYL